MKVYTQERDTLEVTESHEGYTLMIDNIYSGVTPETHEFASILVNRRDAEGFVHSLAKALGVDVSTASEWNEAFGVSTEAVEVHDYHEDFAPGEWDGKRYAVSGDINEFLTSEEEDQLFRKWNELNLDNGSWSSNYFVQDLLQVDTVTAEEFEFESEGMCFFAYTDSKYRAEDLAKWINGKEFLK